MKKTMQLISAGRMITFVVTVLTSIPLFISYLKGIQPQSPLFQSLHTWFGLAFVILAITSMVMQKKNKKKKNQS